MPATEKTVAWNGGVQQEGLEILTRGGGMIVSPTKVGYIIMVSDRAGLERKFDAKVRKRNKPGVVLCGSMDELRTLAQLTPEIEAFYQEHFDKEILLGCILPWKEEAIARIPDDGSRELMMDGRGTSCFVIRYGTPSEKLAEALWRDHGKIAFASSANPSGKGNRGLVEGIGERIEGEADLIIEANDYVASIQPGKTVETRFEQGVMISMVDESGKLIPEQKGERSVSPAPVMIRKGLDIDKIMMLLSNHFLSWDYRQGQYY
ncbi:L-threonylcarbamoyladenylate synthase [Jiella sp. M17.18]|uniref:L-threonylcarbamoyladenylate synthase n=1 Tax=Jiella sp. M17.18 TaxID=3234247 RepID=UPI0034DEB84C